MTRTTFTLRHAALASTAVLALALAGCSDDNGNFDVTSQIGPDPVLPEPSQSLVPDLKVAEVIGWGADETPDVIDGFTITAYAKDLVNPRTVHTLPNGDVLVVQSKAPPGKPVERPKDVIRGFIMSMASGGGGGDKPTNLITLLRDTDRDGTVDERHDLLTDLNSPFGLAFADDTLYVAAADAVLAYDYQLGQNAITTPPRVLSPLPGGPINHHWTKDLALSSDGRFLYASVGSNSNAGERGLEAEKGRAAIWQIDRETGASRVYASGLRNPNGLTINPESGALWTVVNERDELGPNLVPDYMTSVQDRGFYGWPWSYYGQHVDPRLHPPRPDMVEQAIKPDYALSSHVAALGLAFSMGMAMPDDFTNGAFVGNRGSWNRDQFNGYKVLYVPFENGAPAGEARDVVTGFLNGEEQARGRPVGLGFDGTGALLVADDAGNTVWRVAAQNATALAEPLGTDEMPPGSPVAAEQAAAAEAVEGTPPANAPAEGTPASDTPAPDATTPSSTPPTLEDPAVAPTPDAPANTGDGTLAAPTPPQTDVPATGPGGAVQDATPATPAPAQP
ncbi:MAG: PQQ-dependent sugar dehydrogenase [Alphaproteobacteria bacterium]|uniref:PQQ-dependent sugar dehydrogenase n=1 Tax=Rhizobium sp. R86522 TaxID=3093861 RepID=UPI00366CBD76|nr:PQQ-dependent sugar dehydrogenase [Alphaproteobacteria bacterium]MBU0834650.1 PQQ-dependent sugar dehydrogenase [Alphaproteobacteria bacterium]MBU1763785.1 PQQ-dependent sugar dehydrogenase [Alphaproteobacteria bacterium]